jgi:hypothetical protein
MAKLNMVDQYRKCAEICSKIDYFNKASVRASNRAVNKMYKIVVEAVKHGPVAVNELNSLLDEPLSAPWIAHQLLEKAVVSPEVERKCLSIIWKLSTKGPGTQQMGEQIWLKRWYEKQSHG